MASVEIVAIGSELLLGQIVDTNSAWMAERLTGLGVDMYYKTVVGDNPARMKEVIAQALDRSDVVITSGGLGPTQDDLTRETVAGVTGRELVLDPHLLDQIEKRFRSRGFVMTGNNERQAYIPDGAIPVENPNGTAPSFIVEDPRGIVFSLPGVPVEMKWLFDNEVAPYLRRKFDLSGLITHRILKVGGMGESAVDDLIGHLISSSKNPTVGVLAHPGQVDVRITAKAASLDAAAEMIEPVEAEVRGLLGHHVFATDGESMEDAVATLLRQSGKTISVYEDLTAGMLSGRIQQASPDRFVEAVVGGGAAAIHRLLAHSWAPADVDELMGDRARLCNELAWAMKAHTKADLGLALHGVPDESDSAENLARGQTFMAVTDGNGFRELTYNSAGRGVPDRTRLSLNAMELVREALLKGIG
jgi:nicotinamide-nucleotide amidase